jgi:hypothetical protein
MFPGHLSQVVPFGIALGNSCKGNKITASECLMGILLDQGYKVTNAFQIMHLSGFRLRVFSLAHCRPCSGDPSLNLSVNWCESVFDGTQYYGYLKTRIISESLLTMYMHIKLRLDLQADKSSIVVKGPFFLKCEPKVLNPWNKCAMQESIY